VLQAPRLPAGLQALQPAEARPLVQAASVVASHAVHACT